MYAAERQQLIVDRARTQGLVEVNPLALELKVTPETIRRDLSALVRRGLLQRAHGGAIPVEQLVGAESELRSRAQIMTEQKHQIAARALAEVPAEGSIFIEAGSTTGVLADSLVPSGPLTVVTNGLPVAMRLTAYPDITVHMVGGRVRGRTLAAVDDWALGCLADVHVDVAFLGTNGFTAVRGLTTPDSAEAAVKRRALGIAERTILLADHTKLSTVSLHRYGTAADLDLLITDAGVEPEIVQDLTRAGLPVVRA